MVAAPVELVLKPGGPIRKRNHAGQTTFSQQLQRAIDSGEPDLGIFLAYQAEEFVSGKMIARLQKSAQDRVPLVSVLQPNTLQVAIENLLRFAHGFARWRSMIVNPSLQHLLSWAGENPK